MKNLKKEFPVTANYTHLNTAGTGLLSETLLDFRQNHDLDYLVMGSLMKDNQDKFTTKVREEVGKFFNCKAQNVALVTSFSTGFNVFLEALPAKSKVLLLQEDYPSINWPVEARDFDISYAKIDVNLEDNILKAVEKEKPEVLCISLVQYISGVQINLEFLKSLKAEYPDLLICADGTQYCGVAPFDFENSGIDVLGASTYKWLNAGYGNGFFLFKDAVKDRLKPKAVGFASIRGKYKEAGDTLIGKFEPGHLDTLNSGSLQAAIQLVNKIGYSAITTQIELLKEKALNAFAERNLLDDVVINRKQHSSIFNIKGDQQLFEKLKQNDIICSQRGDGIRVSFHYFNTEDDLEKLLKLI
ncbi:selenocysteine lyase/cysteine desulfurase [Leeuwenhoekiella aestuarii]|uniref:Selenocysteine lyase/cysteine desulfurase n=1 Tax=Leeuwenhoekiella aestuarii TaxID=2249426 RepID=A0A4Q0NZP2_9FLAO|nr:aminotransferase class V-fold PLP-dependent enzyme [Leeuwenhoekiella aestuarii]RXG18444.1 selenocysteine lyase/cysteine desulfurase [Leeuwenhoekiella aestuarii]RXG19749.1 selenocysteine lyase/cysteine desulfurase [Leeuwenhoekiella aestuarii]